MIIRQLNLETDFKQLSNFDASFSTDRVYRVLIDGISVALIEEILKISFHKTYPFEFVENDINEADYLIVAEVAEANGVIKGFATARYEGWSDRAVLTGLYVAPESRGKGIGKALINSVTDYAEKIKARCLWLETQNINYPAIQFYRKNSFEFCGFDNTLYNPADVSTEEIAFYFSKTLTK